MNSLPSLRSLPCRLQGPGMRAGKRGFMLEFKNGRERERERTHHMLMKRKGYDMVKAC